MCFFIKLGKFVSHSEKTDPVDFGGQRSKVKVTINLYGNKLVNKPFQRSKVKFTINMYMYRNKLVNTIET